MSARTVNFGVPVMDGLLRILARKALATQLDDIPRDVIEIAKLGITDFFGVAYAGTDMPVAQNVRSYLNTIGLREGHAVLLGRDERADMISASLFNATAGHALDFDDVSWATIGHPSVVVAPCAIACAQALKANGAALLRAYILGVELMHQIARWTMPQLSERGWHTTPANGVFGTATVGALLLGLNEDEFTNALAIAATRAFGVRANFGSQTKALHAGLCAQSGLECALLAKHGITGRDNAIEALDGYAQCLANPIAADQVKIDFCEFWDLRETGLVIKQYPCCSGTHPTLDIWDDFLNEHPLSPDDIESIYAGVSLLGPRELSCHHPINCVQAKFSLEYAIAARLIHGEVGVNTFTDEKVLDQRIQSFMKKVHMRIDPELEKLGFIGTAPIRMRVTLKSGATIALANDLAMGNPEKPLTPAKFEKKFMNCVVPGADSELARVWWNTLQTIETATPEAIASLGARS